MRFLVPARVGILLLRVPIEYRQCLFGCYALPNRTVLKSEIPSKMGTGIVRFLYGVRLRYVDPDLGPLARVDGGETIAVRPRFFWNGNRKYPRLTRCLQAQQARIVLSAVFCCDYGIVSLARFVKGKTSCREEENAKEPVAPREPASSENQRRPSGCPFQKSRPSCSLSSKNAMNVHFVPPVPLPRNRLLRKWKRAVGRKGRP